MPGAAIRHSLVRANATAIIVLWWCTAVIADGVNVTADPYGGPNVSEFPPDSPPSDLGPDEMADAKANVSINADDGVAVEEVAAEKLMVNGIDAKVSGSTDIRQPSNASDGLKGHEMGHHEVFKDEYDRTAKKKAEAGLGEVNGQMYQGQGGTRAERLDNAKMQVQDAVDKALGKIKDSIKQQMQAASDYFDKLTEHGKSTTVDTATGVAETKKHRNKAPAAGDKQQTPNNQLPNAGSDNGQSFYDPQHETLVFQGHAPINHANNPGDPIVGRGEIAVGPTILIGHLPNGALLLSDTRLQILDRLSSDVLMDAFLYELAFTPSSLPGFDGMIQGYLAIPPESAGGTNNTIGSPFLAAMQQDSTNNPATRFWYFTNQDLNALLAGDPNASPFGSGMLVLGQVPEPGGVTLIGISAAVVCWTVARQRRGRALRRARSSGRHGSQRRSAEFEEM